MQHVGRTWAGILTGFLLVSISNVGGQESSPPLVVKRLDGTTIGRLDRILEEHAEWFKSGKEKGRVANLSWADLSLADLDSADLRGANLINADLYMASLIKANLYMARLDSAGMFEAQLTEADLDDAYLTETDLTEANLTRARLSGAHLTGADLTKADLTGAQLSEADLRRTILFDTDLYKANLHRVTVDSCIFEPKIGCVASASGMIEAKDFSSLTFRDSPHALMELREIFKKAGLRERERQLTYAIMHRQRIKGAEFDSTVTWVRRIPGYLQSGFSYLFFEITCQYGMSPARPLSVLLVLLFICSFIYAFAVSQKYRSPKAGIWIVWPRESVDPAGGNGKPVRKVVSWRCVFFSGLYFSVLSAFQIGWRDLNVGSWISRVQRREYTLRATGWVRTVSGLQSLISVYMLALWALTYFGRPFE